MNLLLFPCVAVYRPLNIVEEVTIVADGEALVRPLDERRVWWLLSATAPQGATIVVNVFVLAQNYPAVALSTAQVVQFKGSSPPMFSCLHKNRRVPSMRCNTSA